MSLAQRLEAFEARLDRHAEAQAAAIEGAVRRQLELARAGQPAQPRAERTPSEAELPRGEVFGLAGEVRAALARAPAAAEPAPAGVEARETSAEGSQGADGSGTCISADECAHTTNSDATGSPPPAVQPDMHGALLRSLAADVQSLRASQAAEAARFESAVESLRGSVDEVRARARALDDGVSARGADGTIGADAEQGSGKDCSESEVSDSSDGSEDVEEDEHVHGPAGRKDGEDERKEAATGVQSPLRTPPRAATAAVGPTQRSARNARMRVGDGPLASLALAAPSRAPPRRREGSARGKASAASVRRAPYYGLYSKPPKGAGAKGAKAPKKVTERDEGAAPTAAGAGDAAAAQRAAGLEGASGTSYAGERSERLGRLRELYAELTSLEE